MTHLAKIWHWNHWCNLMNHVPRFVWSLATAINAEIGSEYTYLYVTFAYSLAPRLFPVARQDSFAPRRCECAGAFHLRKSGCNCSSHSRRTGNPCLRNVHLYPRKGLGSLEGNKLQKKTQSVHVGVKPCLITTTEFNHDIRNCRLISGFS